MGFKSYANNCILAILLFSLLFFFNFTQRPSFYGIGIFRPQTQNDIYHILTNNNNHRVQSTLVYLKVLLIKKDPTLKTSEAA